MRCNFEIDTIQSVDMDIGYHTANIISMQNNIKVLRKTLQNLYKQRNDLLFWEFHLTRTPSLTEILSEIPYWESILLDKPQQRVWAYLKRVPGKRFKTKKEGTFTRVYCLPK